MSIIEEIDFIINRKLRPFYYNHLSHYLSPQVFDNLFCLFCSGKISPRVKDIEKNVEYFFFNPHEKENYINFLKRYYPKALDKTIAKADLIVNHVFDLFGSGPVKLGSSIDWHRDFKSGLTWKKEFYKNIEFIRLHDDSDIKVPWELSRFHHLNTLGQAYWISQDEKYVREFVNQLLDWIHFNPPRIGVNWCNPMEVAIRTVNLTSAYFFFKDSPSFTKKIKKVFFKTLLIHQIFIYHNLEFGYRVKQNGHKLQLNDNHFIADLIGLIIPSIVFPTLLFKHIKNKALRWLYREILFQINPDGIHYELSIGYHRLVAEMFLAVAILMQKNRENFGLSIMNKIEQMLDFVQAYIKPDGTAPNTRDSDNSQLFSFTSNSINDHRYILNIGAVLFNRSDFKLNAPTFSHETFWWLGPNGMNKFLELQNIKLNSNSRAFSNSGFFFMKKDQDYLMVNCAGSGLHGYGGHGHNDALSFELSTQGRDVIIDPGTYVYSAEPELRNLFRSTAYHNTIRIDGIEINSFDPNLLFFLPNEAHPKVEKWITKENHDILTCSHSGYLKLSRPVLHRRTMLFNKIKRYWKIIDQLFGNHYHLVEIFFHLAPRLVPYKMFNNHDILFRDRTGFAFLMSMKDHSGWNIEFNKQWVSPSYGIKRRAWTVCCNKLTTLPLKTIFIFQSAS